MKNVKFGVGQINRPTPVFAKQAFRFVLYAAALVNMLLFFIPDIPPHIQFVALKYTAIVTPLSHAISKLFGIDISDVEPPEMDYENKGGGQTL